MIPIPPTLEAVENPTFAFPLAHMDKFVVLVGIPYKVYHILSALGDTAAHHLLAEALFNVSMGRCITGDREYIKKLKLTNDEVNCVATWLEKDEDVFKQHVSNWRNYIFNLLFNNYKGAKTTFSEFKAKHFILLWSRSWLGRIINKIDLGLTADKLIIHLTETQINLDRIYLEAWVKYETPGMGSFTVEERAEECLAAYDEAPYITEPDRENEEREFLPTDGLRKLMTGPKGNRYPSPKRRK